MTTPIQTASTKTNVETNPTPPAEKVVDEVKLKALLATYAEKRAALTAAEQAVSDAKRDESAICREIHAEVGNDPFSWGKKERKIARRVNKDLGETLYYMRIVGEKAPKKVLNLDEEVAPAEAQKATNGSSSDEEEADADETIQPS